MVFFPPGAVILPVKMDEIGMPTAIQTFNIFDIHKALLHFDEKKQLDKYPEEGPGSDEFQKLVDTHRADLKEEYQKARSAGNTGIKPSLREYCRSEAERRVRDCFAGTLLNDTDIFPTKKNQYGMPKI